MATTSADPCGRTYSLKNAEALNELVWEMCVAARTSGAIAIKAALAGFIL
jgi:hypothetical protein